MSEYGDEGTFDTGAWQEADVSYPDEYGGYEQESGLDPFGDPVEFEQAVRGMIQERVAPMQQFYEHQQQERMDAQGFAMVEQVVGGHGERLGADLDVAEVHRGATEAGQQAAFDTMVRAGYSQQALQVVRAGGWIEVLAAVHRVPAQEVALALLEMSADSVHRSQPGPGDERSVLNKHFPDRSVRHSGPSARPPHPRSAELPGWAKDLIARA